MNGRHQQQPAYLVIEDPGTLPAWSPDLPEFREMIRRIADSPAAMAGFWAYRDHLLAHGGTSPAVPAPLAPPPRRSSAVVEAFDIADRDAERERLLSEMTHASPERRRLLMEQALTLHSAAERRRFRGRALRRLHRAGNAELSERAAAVAISNDLKRRCAAEVTSTGSIERDRLCDEIILTGSIPSDRSIRAYLAP